MKQSRILFFVPETAAGNNAVLRARALGIARILSEGRREILVIGTEKTSVAARSAEQRINDEFGLAATIVPWRSSIPGFAGVWATAVRCAAETKQISRRFKPTTIYTQSAIGAWVGRRLARANQSELLFDVKGDIAAEVALRRGVGIRSRLARKLERAGVRAATKLLTVSGPQADLLRSEYGRSDATVVPSSVDGRFFGFDAEAREKRRRELGFGPNEKVLCYSGGLSKWQRIPDILRLFEDLALAYSDMRFLVLSKDLDATARMLEAFPAAKRRAVVHSCGREQVAEYLSAADAGILLRDDNAVNRVASPIKTGEYLSCRLPVIVTRGIGDASRWVEDAGAGLVIDGPTDAARVADYLKSPQFESRRVAAHKLFEERFELQRYRELLQQVFDG